MKAPPLLRPGRKPIRFSAAVLRRRRDNERRKRAGICQNCPGKTAGYVLCEECREISKAKCRDLYRARRERGDCTECGKPANGRTRCPSCVEHRKKLPNRHRLNRRAEAAAVSRARKINVKKWRRLGLCSRCGKPSVPGIKVRMCGDHLAVHERRLADAREARAVGLDALRAELMTFGDCSREDVARIIGISSKHAGLLMNCGRIKARKVHGLWRCWMRDVLRYKAERDAHPERQRSAALQRRYRRR